MLPSNVILEYCSRELLSNVMLEYYTRDFSNAMLEYYSRDVPFNVMLVYCSYFLVFSGSILVLILELRRMGFKT